MGITNLQVGDYVLNVETKEVFEIIKYQWTFCKKCTQLPFMKFCDVSSDPKSLHYRYYVIRNIRTDKQHEISAKKMNESEYAGKIKETTKHKGAWR
jgi:hypothetical protein